MPEPIDQELAQLRARAYGPNADIDDDPRALARLRELEDSRRTAAPPVAPPRPELPAPDASVASHGVTQGSASSVLPRSLSLDSPPPLPPRPLVTTTVITEAGAAPASSPAGSTRWARTLGIAATAAVVATALSVPVTLWAASGINGPRVVLAATDDPVPEDYFGPSSDAVRYEDFFGIRVTVGTFPGQLGRCILIETKPRGVDPDWAAGTTQGTCSAPGFDPVVDVSVAQMAFTDEQLDALDGATGVRFEASGDQVRVYLATAPAETTDS